MRTKGAGKKSDGKILEKGERVKAMVASASPIKSRLQSLASQNKNHKTKKQKIAFDDNRLLPALYGEHSKNLARIEQVLEVVITPRGNQFSVVGAAEACGRAISVLETLYARLQSGASLSAGDIDGALRLSESLSETTEKINGAQVEAIKAKKLQTPKREIIARSHKQADYMDALMSCELVAGLGPAGTGKTYLAVAAAACAWASGKVERLILSRPAIEAGERLGFLPGDMREKVDPYLRPLYDALYDVLPAARVERALASGDIEIAPLAFMRGRTLRNAFIILDEAQNATALQMKMFLTRLGEGSQMVINGDPSQTDLPKGETSGLRDALEVLEAVSEKEKIKIIRFGAKDVVRHDLVAKIIAAYEKRGSKQTSGN